MTRGVLISGGMLAAAALLSGAYQVDSTTLASLEYLVAAERQFADDCRAVGIRTSFLKYLDSSSVVFLPSPINGQQAYATAPETSSGTLSWYPTLADIAASGELGFTTGPYCWTPLDGDAASIRTGQYLSVWRLGPEGEWKVVLDAGVGFAPPTSRELPSAWRRLREEMSFHVPPENDPSAQHAALVTADETACRHLNNRDFQALGLLCLDSVRTHRKGIAPVVGRQSHLEIARDQHVPGIWSHVGGAASMSGDFGYTFGEVRPRNGDTTGSVGYARLWFREPGQPWRIAIDVELTQVAH